MIYDFIKALRAYNIRISAAETMEAIATLDHVGLFNRQLLKDSLSLVLAKTRDDKEAYSKCFDLFFTSEAMEKTEIVAQPTLDATPGKEIEKLQNGDPQNEQSSSLLELLERSDKTALAEAIAIAAQQVQLSNIKIFTQRGIYARRILERIGVNELERKIHEFAKIGEEDEYNDLKLQKAQTLESVLELVDKNLLLYTANSGANLRQEILEKTPLARVEARDFKTMHELVKKLSKRLISIHSRRRRKAKRGALDVRQTIRKNMQFDGVLFNTVWKKVQIDRPKVMAVCDVSGSVAQTARFLLMFLYSVHEIIPKVRSFAFSNQLGEITSLFEEQPIEIALNEAINRWGMGSTDYGGALHELERLVGNEIDSKTTVLILGDGRSNYGDPGHLALKRMRLKSKSVMWLNPEPKTFWNTGDSEMNKFRASCDRVESCRSIRHLERIVSDVARRTI
jgi:hypothetical protein